jgi:hypothetical protein
MVAATEKHYFSAEIFVLPLTIQQWKLSAFGDANAPAVKS